MPSIRHKEFPSLVAPVIASPLMDAQSAEPAAEPRFATDAPETLQRLEAWLSLPPEDRAELLRAWRNEIVPVGQAPEAEQMEPPDGRNRI